MVKTTSVGATSTTTKKRKAASVEGAVKRDKKSDKDSSLTEEKKKRGPNPAFAERKKRQKARVFTCIKTGFTKLCRDDSMGTLVQDCVWKSSIMAVEASLLTSFHILRLLEAQQQLPVMDDTFFNQCVSCIANQGTNLTCEGRNPALMESLRQYKTLQPDRYEPVGRIACMTQMLVMIAQQARQNFVVSTELTITSRLARWFRLKIKERTQTTGTTYFVDNESRIIRSIVSVMTRASAQDSTVAGLVANYTRFQQHQYSIPAAEMIWMQELCDEVRQRIGPTPLSVKSTPEAYMPFLYSILRDLEAYNSTVKASDKEKSDVQMRVFSLLPQKKIRPINVKINNTVLAEMHKVLDNDVHLEGRDLWDYYFETRLVTRSERKEFEKFMVTDGMSASLVVSRPKPAAEKVSEESERLQAQTALETAERVVALDPGRNPIFTAVIHDQYAMDSLQDHNPNNIHHKSLQWSKRRFYHEAGYIFRGKKTKIWTAKAPLIQAFNGFSETAKTSSLNAYKVHIRHVLDNLGVVMDFYSAKRFKRLRWKTYIKRQQAYEKMVADLKGGVENTLIVWGDASFAAAGRGSPAVPTSSMRKKVGSRVKCINQDEFRTSKLSCCCHTTMKALEIDGEKSWHLRVCQNNACPRRVWDRNVSAAINILYLFLNYAKGKRRPAAFRRGNVVDEEDIEEAEAAVPVE